MTKTRKKVPGGPPSALGTVVLRLGASLDLDTVLSEVVDGARALTGADCGAIATVDAAGRPGDFVTSGLTADGHRALEAWPDGPGLLAHLASLALPLRRPPRARRTRSSTGRARAPRRRSG